MSKRGKPILILRTHFVANGPRSSFLLLLQQVADFREQLHFLAGLRRFCGNRHLLFLAMELGNEADEDEDGEGDDDEIKRGLQEVAIVEQHGGLFLSIHHLRFLERDGEVGEVHATTDDANQRHDEVGHDGRHDFSEGRTDNNADGHINNVATHGKRFEVLQECTFWHRYIKV